MNVDSCGSEQVEEGGVGNFVAAQLDKEVAATLLALAV